jgi:hypothetical protein
MRQKHYKLNTPTRYWGVRLTNRVFVSFFCKIMRVFLKKNSEKSIISVRKKASFFCGRKRGAPGLVGSHPFWAALGLDGPHRWSFFQNRWGLVV